MELGAISLQRLEQRRQSCEGGRAILNDERQIREKGDDCKIIWRNLSIIAGQSKNLYTRWLFEDTVRFQIGFM